MVGAGRNLVLGLAAPLSVVRSTLAGGNFDFLILSGQLSGLVLLPDWDVLVLSVNTFTAARLSIVHRSDQVRIPFSVQATAVNDAEAGAERHGYAICCCPGYQRTRYLLPRRSQSTYQLGCLRIERGPGWCQFFLRMSGKAPAEDRIVRVTTNALALYKTRSWTAKRGLPR
jgi:hypothetical protein